MTVLLPRKRRLAQFSIGVIMLAAGAISCRDNPTPAQTAEPGDATLPNVIFVVADTLRDDTTRSTEKDGWLMPNLRALGGESVDFTNAVSQDSWTLPSMVSLFTSLYPEVHRIGYRILDAPNNAVENPIGQASLENVKLMVSYFKEMGYETIGVQTNFHLRTETAFENDFDVYSYGPNRSAEEVVADVALQMRSVGEPYFLYVHFYDTHGPYVRHREMETRMEPFPTLLPDEKRLAHGFYMNYYFGSLRTLGEQRKAVERRLSPNEREFVRHLYRGEARYLDEFFGSMLKLLKKVGKFDDDIVVFVGDHGEELWEHGALGHGRTVYQEVIHVPLIMKFPGEKPRVVDAPVELIDVLPTLAGRIGIPRDPHWQGRDLFAKGTGDRLDDRRRFVRTLGVHSGFDVHWESVLSGDMKYIYNEHEGSHALYDLRRDPGETNNVFESLGQAADSLRAALAEFKRSSLEHPVAQINVTYETLDEDRLEELQAIGYLK